MQLPQPFDARTVDPTQGGGGLPASDANGHLVIVTKSEPKMTKEQDGGFLELTLQIIDQNSPHRGKEGVWRLNLFNKSQQAVEIAYKQLSALGHVVGVYLIQATEQLHNIPFRAIVGPQRDQPQYTEVKKVLDANGHEPGKGQQQPVQSVPAGQWPNQAPQQQPQQQPQQPAQQQPAWGAQPQQNTPQAPAMQPAPAWGQPAAAPQGTSQSAPWGQQQAQPGAMPPANNAPAWSGQQQPTAAPQQSTGTPPWGAQTSSGSGAAPPWGAPR